MHKLSILLVILFVVLIAGLFGVAAYVMPKLLPLMDLSRDVPVGESSLPEDMDTVADPHRDPVPPVKKRVSTLGEGAEIKITSPNLDWFLDPEVVIRGEAVGTWFFEADFPVRLEDSDGTVLARGIARAEGEWMTEDYVPFMLVLNYDAPATEGGKLIFERDNPSGRPEFEEEITVNVKFRMTTKHAGEACTADADCILPGEFAIRSTCPYEVKCLKERCTVDCTRNFE